jgi:hypothetical protein
MPNLTKKYKEVHEKLAKYKRSVLQAPQTEGEYQDHLDVLWRSMTEHERLEIHRWLLTEVKRKDT